MKWFDYFQEETNIGTVRDYPRDSEGYSGILYRTTQDRVRIDRLGDTECSNSSHRNNRLWDRHHYRAQFKGMVTKPAEDIDVYRYRGWVEATVDDPTNVQPSPSTGEGAANGRAYWEFQRNDNKKESNVHILNSFSIAGEHFATRNPLHSVNFNKSSLTQESPIRQQSKGSDVKGSDYGYSFSYEFTNHYRDIYRCTDSRSDGCYAWVFVERVPEWSKGQTFRLSDTIKVDSAQQDTIKADTIDQLFNRRKSTSLRSILGITLFALVLK